MEESVERWLLQNRINYRRDDQSAIGTQLDFYLPDFDLYIEVKRFHTVRIADQMARAKNVIAIQGIDSLIFLETLIHAKENPHAPEAPQSKSNSPKQGEGGGTSAPKETGPHRCCLGEAQSREGAEILSLLSEPTIYRLGNAIDPPTPGGEK